jgi:iron(III)-salmochelin esterase
LAHVQPTLMPRKDPVELRVGRRSLVHGVCGIASTAALACGRRAAPSAAASTQPVDLPLLARATALPAHPEHEVVRLTLSATQGGPAEIAVLVPKFRGETRYPVVIALHGRGESQKPAAEGCLGWIRDYGLERAANRLRKLPLISNDFEDLAQGPYLHEYNAELTQSPYAGLVVVCPHMPDFDLQRDVATQLRYGRFLVESLLPRIREEFPVQTTAAATGIDGVSLGGLMALRVGFTFAESFGAVGGIQPALQAYDAQSWAELALKAQRKYPSQVIRLLTSDKDYFRDAVERASAALTRVQVRHEYRLVPGPHDYIFNRTLGAYELLRFHSRELHGAPAGDAGTSVDATLPPG